MKLNPHVGAVQSLINHKLLVYKQHADKVLRIQQQQVELEKALLAQAPESLRDFLAEGWLSSILDNGICTGKADLADCNCKNYDEAKLKFNKLKTAWTGVIKISFPAKRDFDNAGRLELKFFIN